MTAVAKIPRTETDFLVIGGGLAGLYASLAAARHGEVALVSKSALTASSSAWAQGGIAAAIASDDSTLLHLEDTLRAGRGLCNERAVEILVRQAPESIHKLEKLGVEFDRNEGGFELGREGGHSRRRILHAGGSATGGQIVAALARRVLCTDAIRVYDGQWAADLLADEDVCYGALTYARKEAQLRAFVAPVTILATGGAAGLYFRTTNPPTSIGEGVALAYRAGADIADMEFIQFHPTALVTRDGRSPLISEAVRGEGAILLDSAGRRFMPEYHELAELAPRDVVASAIHREMSKSGSDCVFLSLRHLSPDLVKSRFVNLYETCLEAGFDMTRDLIPVAPAAHYTIGGVRTDLNGQTSLAGLWACGEVAATGVHGANRLASNSLLECIVFADRAVETAAAGPAVREAKLGLSGAWPKSQELPLQPCDEANSKRLAMLLTERAGLVRSQTGLNEAWRELAELWAQSLEAVSEWRNRLQVARLIAQAALLRTETRGVHVREDSPKEEASWLKHIVLNQRCDPQFVSF